MLQIYEMVLCAPAIKPIFILGYVKRKHQNSSSWIIKQDLVSRQKICCPSIAPRLRLCIMSNSSESIYLHILSFVVFLDYSLPWFISVDYIWFSYHKHFMNKNRPAFPVVYLILWWSILNLSVYALS